MEGYGNSVGFLLSHIENSLKGGDHVCKVRAVTMTFFLQLPHLFLMSAGAEELKVGYNRSWSFSKVSMTKGEKC